MKCPHCSNKLLQKSEGGGLRLRITGALEIVDGVCKASCYWCKGSVDLPLLPKTEVLEKAEAAPVAVERVVERVFVRKVANRG